MTDDSLNHSFTINPSTREAFLQHLHDKPNGRRISQAEKDNLIEWLTKPLRRPSSQKEFSRRNYVRKTFTWDENTQKLLAIAKKDEDNDRAVVTEDMIADVVGFVHENNGHAGWDATWKDVSSSYYGILRSDVIFLLKQCETCAKNTRKRPKGSATATFSSQLFDHSVHSILDFTDLFNDNCSTEVLENENNLADGSEI